MLLFIDTETTGLPLFNEPSEDPRQPHLVQLAAVLCTDDGAIRSTIDLTIRPNGWIIPDEVAAIHGVTREIAMRDGVEESLAVELMMDMVGRSTTVVAHNFTFDARIIRIALKRYECLGEGEAERWAAAPSFCTMRAATRLCAVPPTSRMLAAGRRGPKAPTLVEAMRILLGEELQNAHSAIADAQACRRIWLELARRRELGEVA